MQPANKSFKSPAPGWTPPPPACASEQPADRKCAPAQGLTARAKAEGKADDAASKPLDAYEVRVAPSLEPSSSAPSRIGAESLQRIHARADASLQAFITAEGDSLPPDDQALFIEFLEHGEFGLAYDTAVGLLQAGWTWPAASVAHLKAAASAMGIEFPQFAHG